MFGKKGGCHSIVIVSDYLSHDRFAVNVFLKAIVDWLDDNIHKFKEYSFFSDGAASQFKQRFHLCSLSLLDRDVTWQFFATSHGKGAVDGIGGTVNYLVAVSRSVMT